MYDYHIHSRFGADPKKFLKNAAAAGITGGGIISPHPLGYCVEPENDQRWENLLDYLMEFTSQTPGFKPVFWIDPTDADIEKQIHAAASRGVAGFKIICNHFFPKDILKPLRVIAETKLPVNFHSGILYSEHPAAEYNRPAAFECLMEVKGLKFSMAHIGWPWTDEYVSIVGEFGWGANNVQMYVDLTPGTPLNYRREVLRTMYLTGFGRLRDHVLWGTDKGVNDYPAPWVKYLADYDREVMESIKKDVNNYHYPNYDFVEFYDIFERATGQNFEDFFRQE